jgi:carbamoyl-phosphate synthase large subunit
MGGADFSAASLPAVCQQDRMVNCPLEVGGQTYAVTCLSVGNPHCVVYCDKVDSVDTENIGPLFEHAAVFPERINTEFVRVVNKNMLKMRVWERGNGETLACGTGACAAVAAAVENGLCAMGEDVVVKLRGGDLTVNYSQSEIVLTGDTKLVFEGTIYY